MAAHEVTANYTKYVNTMQYYRKTRQIPSASRYSLKVIAL